MFKRIILNIIFFLAGLAIMFGFIKACDTFLWFQPSLYPLSVRPDSIRLIAKGGPFKIYSHPGTGQQDFAVFRGNDPIVRSEVISKGSNIYEIMYGGVGWPFIHARFRNKQPESYAYSCGDIYGHEYTYFDNNADGLWDRFFDEKNGKSYEWQNDRWYQIVSNNPITLGTNVFCVLTKSSDAK